MSKRTTPTAAKVPTERTDAAGNHAEQPVTKLVDIQDPAKLTAAQIRDISGDDGTDSAENSANRDVADSLRADREAAKSPNKGEDTERGYYHGHGGGVGGPG